MIKKVKNTVSWTYVINYLNGEKIVGIIYEKKIAKIKKILKKAINDTLNRKDTIIRLIIGLIKKTY